MKKKLFVLLLSIACLLMLTGCFCEHEWKDADCVNPVTCVKCEKTEGEALGHVWLAATCEAPKTCESCGETEGEALGHSWVDADCENPQTCETCGKTEGEALGHSWLAATTEQPQTCEVCAATEGERIITDPRFTTGETQAIQGKWSYTIPMGGTELGLPDFDGTLDCVVVLNFGNDGTLNFNFELSNSEDFTESLVQYTLTTTYAEFAAQGMDKEAADAAVKDSFGMSMEDYVRYYVSSLNLTEVFNSAFSALNLSGVYYMQDGVLYTGLTWDGAMEEEVCTLTSDTLVIESLSEELGMEAVFTRVGE